MKRAARRRALGATGSVSLLLFGAGCGAAGDGSGAAGVGPASPRVLRASVSSAEGEPQTLALRRFAADVGERTEGRIDVRVYPSSALGDEREVIELVMLGAVGAAAPSNAPLATFVPDLLLLDLPFLFEDRDHFDRTLDGEVGAALGASLARRGLELLGFFDLGLRHVMTRNAPIRTAEDFGGLKIRTMENPLHLGAFRAFGANPLPMAYGELYTALEQGVIDGAEAAATNYFTRRFHEVAPFWAEVGWMHLVAPFVMNREFFEDLPPADQRAVRRAAAAAVRFERAEYRRQEGVATRRLEAAGVTITRPDRASLRALADAMTGRLPPGLVDPEILAAVAANRRPPG